MAVRIIKESMYDNWVSDTITYNGKDYRYEAKVFDECSDYGINKGRISKLYVTRDGEEVIAYDRGWDIKPQDKDTIKVFKMILDKYPEDHPIEEATVKKQPGYQDMLIFDKGEIYKTDSGEFEVLDQLGDYVLLKNKNEKNITPFIVADFPMKNGWAAGHYFRTYEDALNDFNERTEDEDISSFLTNKKESKKLKEDTVVSATTYGEDGDFEEVDYQEQAIQFAVQELAEELADLVCVDIVDIDDSPDRIYVDLSYLTLTVDIIVEEDVISFYVRPFYTNETVNAAGLEKLGEDIAEIGKVLNKNSGLVLQY